MTTGTTKAEAGEASERHPSPWRAAGVLAWREMLRFLRQRNRVIGAVGQPVLFWLLFGAGLQGTFRLGADGPSFLQYYVPGTLVLILLFTAIFTTISVIEDRREGFLQGVLVAPISAGTIVLGKVLGGSAIALLQGLLFVLLAWSQLDLSVAGAVQLAGLMTLAAIGLTSLGLVMAWRMESTQGFHAIMNLVLMPLWLLSGGFFPVPQPTDGGQQVLHWIMRANPLAYVVAETRRLMSGDLPGELWMPSRSVCWSVTVVATALLFAWAGRVVRVRKIRGEP